MDWKRKGYGTRAIKLAIIILQAVNNDVSIKIAIEQTNKKAQDLYLSLGFKKLDELDGDDLVFAL